MLYPFVTVSVIYCYVIMLMAQIHDHFTAHASVCQEIGQGSAGTVRLCSTCCRLWGLGPQMASHSCFFHFYFSLSNLLIFSQSSFTASLIWNQYSNDYKNGIYSNLASEDWSICQSTRDNKWVMPEWGCIISIKDEIAVPILVWAEICLDCVQSTLWSMCVLHIHLHMCVHACVPRCSWSFVSMLSPIPDVFFLWRELVGWNTWYFCDPLSILPWRGGVIYLISNFGKISGPFLF